MRSRAFQVSALTAEMKDDTRGFNGYEGSNRNIRSIIRNGGEARHRNKVPVPLRGPGIYIPKANGKLRHRGGNQANHEEFISTC